MLAATILNDTLRVKHSYMTMSIVSCAVTYSGLRFLNDLKEDHIDLKVVSSLLKRKFLSFNSSPL